MDVRALIKKERKKEKKKKEQEYIYIAELQLIKKERKKIKKEKDMRTRMDRDTHLILQYAFFHHTSARSLISIR
jgi:hypothetical protein